MQLSISKDLSIDADALVTGRTCVIGQSGSGKSYTVAVICEELARNKIGFCIIDIEGEYYTLKEKFPLLWAGTNSSCEIDIENVNFSTLAQNVISKQVGLIFDVSDVMNPNEKVQQFISALYKSETKMRTPYLLIIEEIDKFAPQSGKSLPEIDEVSRRGRKRGIGLMVATQRPALVSKNVLSQCGNQIIGKLTIPHDLEAVKIFFDDHKKLEQLPKLSPGEFFIQGNINPKGDIVRIKKRETQHRSATPSLMSMKEIKHEDIAEIERDIETKEETITEEKDLAVIPMTLEKKDATEMALQKSKGLLGIGQEGSVTGVVLELIPIIECEVKYPKGRIIGKDYITENAYLDGITGEIIDPSAGLSPKENISQLMRLSEVDIRALKEIFSKEQSITEIEIRTGISEPVLRKSLDVLSAEGLVNFKKEKNSKIYFRFTNLKIPKLTAFFSKTVVVEKQKVEAKVNEASFKPEAFRNVIRGINKESELTKHKVIYYPIYRIHTLKGNKKHTYTIDAVRKKFI